MTSTIKSYTTLPVSIPSTSSKSITHTIYLQEHIPKVPTEADTRSLFLVNLPIDTTAAHLRSVVANLLGSSGRVEDVFFDGDKKKVVASTAFTATNTKGAGGKKRKRGMDDEDFEFDEALPEIWDRKLHKSGSSAIVVFVDQKSTEAVLKAVRKIHKSGHMDRFPVWGEGLEKKLEPLGSARYEAHHALRYPDVAILQANVDAFMTAFNAREELKKRDESRKRNVPDEDGFVTVTRGGRVGPARTADAEEKRKEMEEREEKKRKEREGEGFYRFQVRERKKQEQGELIRQFEEDKRRVQKLREGRGRKGIRPEN